MTLMDRYTGKTIEDFDHLKQSIRDILTTPRGTRVYVREYGSILFYLVDRNITPLLVSQMYGAIAESITTWEPRFLLTNMQLDASFISQGMLICDMEGLYVPDGKPIRLQGIELVYNNERNLLA